MRRHQEEHVATWRREGCVQIERFFTPDEVSAVVADFETVFGRVEGGHAALAVDDAHGVGRFDDKQFSNFENVPFACSPALNLIGVHPALMAFARAALGSERIHLYQCQAWAKFTGDADYEQPFHCDYANHTLVAPSENATRNSVTIICYFSDVSEAHGPMHYVNRSDSLGLAGPEAMFSDMAGVQERLKPYERSSAAPAGTIFPYSIDVWHRATNMTAPGGRRFAVMACFRAAGDDAIGYTAWPLHFRKPWAAIFDHASPDQLSCFGVALPGDPFWTPVTLARAQARYPNWDLRPYRQALGIA